MGLLHRGPLSSIPWAWNVSPLKSVLYWTQEDTVFWRFSHGGATEKTLSGKIEWIIENSEESRISPRRMWIRLCLHTHTTQIARCCSNGDLERRDVVVRIRSSHDYQRRVFSFKFGVEIFSGFRRTKPRRGGSRWLGFLSLCIYTCVFIYVWTIILLVVS